jgi:hypothetical protein
MKTMNPLIIESNVPLPNAGRAGVSKYPFAAMQIGDCVFVPSDFASIESVRSSAINISKFLGKEHYKFTVHKEPGGCRVWRIEVKLV